MHDLTLSLLDRAQAGHTLSAEDIHLLAENASHATLLQAAEVLTLAGHGANVGYSRKVFIPLTMLCQDRCGYCTFATTPTAVPSAYLSADEVLAIARAGAAAGCHEALFTLGERPESRYQAARDALAALGGISDLFAPELTILSYQHGAAKPCPTLFQILTDRLAGRGITLDLAEGYRSICIDRQLRAPLSARLCRAFSVLHGMQHCPPPPTVPVS